MNIIDSLIMEFTHEMGNTRKLLERAPEDKFDWTPHEKSMTLGKLASHIAELPTWVLATISMDELVIEPDYKPFLGATSAEVLSTFDEAVAAAQECMPGTTNEHLMATWKLKMGGEVMFEMPRIVVLRSFVLNHTIHHRGQFEVYLRMQDVPLPSIYGPSADEQG